MSTAEVAEILRVVDEQRWLNGGAFAWFWSCAALVAALQYADAQLPVWIQLRKIIDTEEVFSC